MFLRISFEKKKDYVFFSKLFVTFTKSNMNSFSKKFMKQFSFFFKIVRTVSRFYFVFCVKKFDFFMEQETRMGYHALKATKEAVNF